MAKERVRGFPPVSYAPDLGSVSDQCYRDTSSNYSESDYGSRYAYASERVPSIPSRVLTTTTGTTAPLNIGSVSSAPSSLAAGDICNNSSNNLIFCNGTSSLGFITTDGTTLGATQIPSVSAAASNELSALGPTITGAGDIGSIISASGSGNATFASLIASGSSTGSLQLFDSTHTHSLTVQPASAPTGATTLLLPLAGGTVATLAGTETLTNKTLTAPVIAVPDANFTIDSSTDSTKIAAFSAAKITTGNTRTLQLPDRSGVVITGGASLVTFSATPAFDTTSGTVQRISLSADVTSSTIDSSTTPSYGQRVVFYIINTGTYTFAFPPNVKGPMTVAANKSNVQAFFYDTFISGWIPEGPGISF